MSDELARAQARIAELETELEEARRDDAVARQVKQALTAAAAAGTLGSPLGYSELLRLIIRTAADVIDAESAVLLLVDEEGDELEFDVTFGVEDDELQGMRLPFGHGIAGLVAATGQPLALSDAADDPRVAREIADSLPYVPTSILCVPLFYDDRLIGVLEVLDKDGGRSFTSHDIETLGAFAKQAAIAIRQSSTHRNLAALMGEVLESLGETDGLRADATAFAARVEADPAYRRTRELTELVREVSRHGEAEVAACAAILRNFADYLRTREEPRGEIEPIR
jgi:GAF domain-containing protein